MIRLAFPLLIQAITMVTSKYLGTSNLIRHVGKFVSALAIKVLSTNPLWNQKLHLLGFQMVLYMLRF